MNSSTTSSRPCLAISPLSERYLCTLHNASSFVYSGLELGLSPATSLHKLLKMDAFHFPGRSTFRERCGSGGRKQGLEPSKHKSPTCSFSSEWYSIDGIGELDVIILYIV
jgi:hypothetical protein